MNNPEVVDVLATLVRRYDVTVIQEIRDISNTAAPALLVEVNSELAPEDQ